jgi:hypothetical protein
MNYSGSPSHVEEPICVHSSYNQPQPMSACRHCKDSPELAAWREYWAKVRKEVASLPESEWTRQHRLVASFDAALARTKAS